MSRTKEQVYRELHLPKDKEPFVFEYTMPLLDWYETIKVTIKPEDYYYFHLERRFGRTWYLVGCNPVDEPSYHWEYKELGQIGSELSNYDVKRFIEWAKSDNGSRITRINVISGSFDIFKEIEDIFK